MISIILWILFFPQVCRCTFKVLIFFNSEITNYFVYEVYKVYLLFLILQQVLKRFFSPHSKHFFTRFKILLIVLFNYLALKFGYVSMTFTNVENVNMFIVYIKCNKKSVNSTGMCHNESLNRIESQRKCLRQIENNIRDYKAIQHRVICANWKKIYKTSSAK